MSKITKPDTEGSVTCGFYNSINDRKYDATQMSAMFDGLINDGVFATIDDAMVVKASSGKTVIVGKGKCWFDHTWTVNDAPLPVQCGDTHVLLDRIDAIVVQINTITRDNTIEIVEGTAASSPVRPTLTNNSEIHQHALCYIYRKAESIEIKQEDITNVIGTDETPFVTGIVQVVSLDTLLGQWTDQLNQYIASGELKINNFIDGEESDFNTWYADMKQLMNDATAELGQWTTAEKNTIMNWFDNVKDQLSEDAALSLQNQIDASTVERFLIDGLPDGKKTISEDGTVIKVVDSKGRVLLKTFTNNFLTITSVLKDREDKEYLSYPYSIFDSSNMATVNGITFTSTSDGKITANGTATADVLFVISKSDFTLNPDTYNLSGCPIGGSEETYYFGAELYNGNTYVSNSTKKDTGYGVMLDLNNETYTKVNVFICIKSGVTVNNVVFNPSVNITGSVLGTLVKEISADGRTINSTLTNTSDVIPNMVQIERGLDTIIANENKYIGGENI